MNMYDPAAPLALSRVETADLSKQVEGPVLLPGDAGYEAECATFNLMSRLRPCVAVGATSAADVQAAVRFAAKCDLPVAVLATGHQMVRSAEGALLINMSRMKAVHINAGRSVARVEGGARWQQVLDETDNCGLAPASGTSPTVGVVGYHLGGGASPILGRMYGYAADHVQAMEIVTPDGHLCQVTENSEQELFWAVRGGKGNFGVVTALEFTLFPITSLYAGGLFFGGEYAAKVLRAWREWVPGLPREMSSSLAFLRRPDLPMVPEPLRGRFVLQVRFASLRPRDEAERLLAPIRGIAPTVMDTVTELRYGQASSIFLDPPAPVPWIERSTALRHFPAEAADALLAVLGPDSATHLRLAELRPLDEAMAQPPIVPNAVAGRSARWSLFAAGGGPPELIPLLEEQLTGMVEAMKPWAQDEINPNLLSARQGRTPEELRAIYGPERYDRLLAIKNRYDPRNLFRMNHNITSVIP